MKKCTWFLTAIAVSLSSLTFGAYLEYDSSSIWAQSRSIASDANSTDDSDNQVNWSDFEASIATNAYTTDDPDMTAETQAESIMGYYDDYDEAGGLHVYAYAWAFGETYTSEASCSAYAGASGVAPGQATGLFFRIMPDDGEQVGDSVEVTLDWNGYASVTDSGIAQSSNGFLGNDDPGSGIVVALNPSDKIVPPAASRVWEHDVIDQMGDGYQEDFDQLTFAAKVGDLIGVFAGVHAEVDISGQPGYGEADAGNLFTFSLEYIGAPSYTAADADIDGSGFVDWHDFAILAQFWLQEAPGQGDASTCENAAALPGFGTYYADNYGALHSSITSCGGGNDSNAVWYSFTSPVTSEIRFIVSPYEGNGLDASLALYETCGGSEIACDEAWVEDITIFMNSGESVIIRIGGYELQEGDFELEIQQSGPM